MDIFKRQSGSTLTVTLRGELDQHSADTARRELDSLIASEGVRTLVLDMRGVTFMDSSGLGVVLGRYRGMSRKGGGMRISGVSRCADRIMKMAGIYSLIEKDEQGGSI